MFNGIVDKNDKFTDELINAFLTVKNEQQCRQLLYEIFSESEIIGIAQRYEVAQMLETGALYSDISQKTGANGALIRYIEDTLKKSMEYKQFCTNELKDKNTENDCVC